MGNNYSNTRRMGEVSVCTCVCVTDYCGCVVYAYTGLIRRRERDQPTSDCWGEGEEEAKGWEGIGNKMGILSLGNFAK